MGRRTREVRDGNAARWRRRTVDRQRLAAFLTSLILAAPAAAAPFAYVTSPDFGTVSVIDAATDTVVTTVNTGGSPQHLATGPGGQYVYVVRSHPGDVKVIETATNSVVGTIPIGSGVPWAVAAHPTGDRLYVANLSVNSVAVASTATQTVIDTAPISSTSNAIAAHPAGAKVYVVRPDRVDVVGTATNDPIGFIAVASPTGIALNPSGTRAYVTSSFYGTVSVIDTATDTIVDSITVGSGASTLAVSPDGSRIYVVHSNFTGSLSVVDAASGTVVTTTGLRNLPSGVAVHPDGTRLYVLNSDTFENNVSVIHIPSLIEVSLVPVGYRPIDIAFATSQPTTAVSTTVATGFFTGIPGGFLDGQLEFDEDVFSLFGMPYSVYSSLGGYPVDVSSTYTGWSSSGLGFSASAVSQGPSVLTFAGQPLLAGSGPSVTWPLTSLGGNVLPSGPFYTLTIPVVDGFPYAWSGAFTLTASLAANTPAAANVTVPVTTSVRLCNTAQPLMELPIAVTFANVTTAGSTYVTGTCQTPGTFPPNIALDAVVGDFFFDVVTNANYDPPITICIGYPDANNDGIVDGTGVDELLLRILHDADGSGFDPPATQSVEAANNRVCAVVDSLSPFALGVEGVSKGFVPPDADALACAGKLSKLLVKHAKARIKCNRRAADAAFNAKSFDAAACETAARAKYDDAVAALGSCPACLLANAPALGDQGALLSEQLNGAWYCDGSTPLAGSDSGFVPSDDAGQLCGKKTGGRAAKLTKQLVTCYRKAASAALRGAPADVDACLADAASGFDAAIGQLSICPGCALGNAPGVRNQVERFAAEIQDLIFCEGTTPLSIPPASF